MDTKSNYSLFLDEIQKDSFLTEGEKQILADLFSLSNVRTQTLSGLKQEAISLMFNLEPIDRDQSVHALWKDVFSQVKARASKPYPQVLEKGEYPVPDIKRSDVSRLKASIVKDSKHPLLIVTDAFLALPPNKQAAIMAHEAKHLFEHLPLKKSTYTLVKVTVDSVTRKAFSKYNEKQADLEAVDLGFGFDLANIFSSVKSKPVQTDENTKLRQVSYFRGLKAAINHDLGLFQLIPPLQKKFMIVMMESILDDHALDPHPDLDKRIDYVLKESYRRAIAQKPYNPLALS